jgi:N-acetylneuraminic acid mutarotase
MIVTSRRLLAILTAALAVLTFGCGGDDDATTSPSPAPLTPATQAPPISPTAAPTSGTWRTLAPMPTPRSEVAAVELNRQIYVIGGFEEDGSASDKVEVYDPATNSWSEAAPLPEPRHHAAAFVFGTIFVMGGYQGGFDDPQNTIYQYASANDTWSEAIPLPQPRGALAAGDVLCDEQVFLGACIFAIGGSGADGRNIAEVDYNDPGGVWMKAAPMLTPRDHLAIGNVDDVLYAIGGRQDIDFSRNLNANEMYDRETDTWTPRAPLPTARSGIAAAEFNKRIYVFGGEGSTGTFNENEVYDPATDTWETLAPMPTARHGLGAATLDGTIYVIGGGPTPGGSVSDINEAYTP